MITLSKINGEECKHGCNIQGQLGLIEYSDRARHGFNTANQRGGLFDWLDRACAIAKEHHPDMVVILGVPDLVFSYGVGKSLVEGVVS
jgi:hypothetical protein